MRLAALVAAAALCIGGTAQAERPADRLRECLLGAASRNNVPAAVLVLIYQNEGGMLGKASHNTNGTDDLGPFQINSTWVDRIAAHWGLSQPLTYQLLLHDLCANTEAAAWVLRLNLDSVHDDLWEGVGRYHSATPHLKEKYLRRIYANAVTILKGDAHVGRD